MRLQSYRGPLTYTASTLIVTVLALAALHLAYPAFPIRFTTVLITLGFGVILAIPITSVLTSAPQPVPPATTDKELAMTPEEIALHESVLRGLTQSAAGETTELGDFTQYVTDSTE